MAKRVSFDPIVQERENQDDQEPLPKKSKHTLDSDEESGDEENGNYDIMDDFEGQEEGEIRREQDVTITPFNMNDELEEGHIDKEGMYIFKKQVDQVTDHWLDNIDSVQLKEPVPRQSREDVPTNEPEKLSTNDCYRKMIELVLPGETVKKAIQRLGRKGKKSLKNKPTDLSETERLEQENDREKMLELISVADQVLDAGDMDIYERTFEQLNFRLKEAEELSKGTDDMFADPEKEGTQVPIDSIVMWLLKWEDKDDAEVHGPFTNDQMIQWSGGGYFVKGAWVRQVGKQDSKFYSTRRTDFELYS